MFPLKKRGKNTIFTDTELNLKKKKKSTTRYYRSESRSRVFLINLLT